MNERGPLPDAAEIRQELHEMAFSTDRTGWEDVKRQLCALPEGLVLPVLSEGVQDVDPAVRCQAGTLLMDFQGGRHVDHYRSLFRDPVDWVRWNITGKASLLQDVDLDLEIRERLLTDEEVSVQVAATYYLNEVVGFPAVPFILWLITHPTEPDLQGHTRHRAAEDCLTSLLLFHAIRFPPEVLQHGGVFQRGPMTCRIVLRDLPGGAGVDGEELPSLVGHTPYPSTLVAESPHGCFSVELMAHLDGEGMGLKSVKPTTYRFWGVPSKPPPMRVQG